MSSRDATLSVHVATAAGVIGEFAAPSSGINIWGALLRFTAASAAVISDGTNELIALENAGAGSVSVMFPVPIFLTIDPDVDSITAGADLYIYFSLA